MTHEELKKRSAQFACRVTTFARPLIRELSSRNVALQLTRAANSVASNYRSTGLARSHAEFISRLAIVLDESDESLHWLTHLRTVGLAAGGELSGLAAEAQELVKIFAASYRTARANRTRKRASRDPMIR